MRTAFLVLLITLLAMPAFAIYVPANGTTVIVPVASGWYDVYASGVFYYGDSSLLPWSYADAEWIHQDIWYESYNGTVPDLAELTVNGMFPDWEGKQLDDSYVAHTISASHEYRTRVYTENVISLQVYDWIYSDNSGGLDVRTEAVPEPSSLLALVAGIATLTTLKRRKRG